MILYSIRVILGLLSIVLIIGGIFLKMHILPAMIKSQIYENLDLREGTEGFNAFKEPPAPVYLSYSLFHIKNTNEVIRGEPPVLLEVGPYSYRETMRKENLMEQNSRYLSYGKYTKFEFDERNTHKLKCKNRINTPCSKNDKITIINPVLLTLADKLDGLPKTVKDIFFEIINNGNEALGIKAENLFITEEVDKILYTGFDSKSAAIFDKLDTFIMLLLEALDLDIPIKAKDFENIIKIISPAQLSEGTFAFFKGKNATKLQNYYTIENGRFDKESFMNIVEFNGKNKLPEAWWPNVATSITGQLSSEGGSCHRIYGTDGTQFPPFLFNKKKFPLWMFVGELCRTIYVEFESEVEVEGGITAYRYGVGKRVFSMSNPENFCYCQEFFSCAKQTDNDEWDLSQCLKCKDGVMDVSACYGAPIFMSQPHFLQADKEVQAYVKGLEPNSEKHATYLDIEPNLGTPLRAHKKIQINMVLRKVAGIDLLKKVADFRLIPMFWADEGAELDSEKAEELNNVLFSAITIGNTVGIALGYVVGPLLLIVSIILSFYQRYREKRA
ncbi:lysosome membrane protein 2 [Lepeophtheirus salmonis]|uniref:lysosome membrane protein 2 n=1 Tax=Lepeophtheirus salmonis TaxID=72036 RepID=UPI001AE8FF61|nr:lysosome membrane protein 2-like [Lepeophtheirus salmonis]